MSGIDVPQTVADAVDVMVDVHGVAVAESELQQRFTQGESQDRVTAALSYLRQQYDTEGDA